PAVGPSGEVYVTWKEIGPLEADFIQIRKSTNQGASFGATTKVTDIYDNFGTGAPGFNRQRGITFPAIAVDRTPGANRGRVYVTWKELGLLEADFIQIRKSTNQGASFGATTKVTDIYDNFGTGAPGFNRQRGITFPAIAVDRTPGANRGRVYVTWNECINWYN